MTMPNSEPSSAATAGAAAAAGGAAAAAAGGAAAGPLGGGGEGAGGAGGTGESWGGGGCWGCSGSSWGVLPITILSGGLLVNGPPWHWCLFVHGLPLQPFAAMWLQSIAMCSVAAINLLFAVWLKSSNQPAAVCSVVAITMLIGPAPAVCGRPARPWANLISTPYHHPLAPRARVMPVYSTPF